MGFKIAFHTLGCKLNYSETSSLSQEAEKNNFILVPFSEVADIYVLNTCSVTENADKECRQIVRRVKRITPESKVVVIGCYAQLQPDLIAQMSEVDLVLGAKEKFQLINHLNQLFNYNNQKINACGVEESTEFYSGISIGSRTRTFLKVQDGCNYPCSYCTIPLARGKSRSNTIENVLKDIEYIASQGVKEIVLTGINLGDFGNKEHTSQQNTFFDLLQAIELQNTSVKRFRISSIEPNLLTNKIIELVAHSKKLMPHFHIPLQSGSDKILKLMRRRYVTEKYKQVVVEIKKQIPDCAIGVDVIVGFPSESVDDFKETYLFLENLDISYLHVFTYSERPNTPALEIRPIVPFQLRQERNLLLRNLSDRKYQEFVAKYKNTQRPVLFEYEKDVHHKMQGYTDNYIRIKTNFKNSWCNEILPFLIS
ncbi:MAG: tRNA (N(6)-L-threonylcarbamoyladenosine(37)-C(2))-methylthiotransferase MtaB [Chitinophagaceae bacterium]